MADLLHPAQRLLWRLLVSLSSPGRWGGAVAAALFAFVLVGLAVPAHCEPEASAAAPKALTKALTVTSSANTPAVYSSTFVHEIADCLNTTTGVPVFVVEESATSTDNGHGPHCDTCAGPAAFPVGKAWLRTSSGTAEVRCTFYDRAVPGLVGKPSGGGGLRGDGANHEVAFFNSTGGLDGDPALLHTEGAGTLRSELDLYKSTGGGWAFISGGTDGNAEIRNYGSSAACNWKLSAPTGDVFRVGTCSNPLLDVSSSGLSPVWPIAGSQTLGTGSTPWARLYLRGTNVSGTNTLIEWQDGASGTTTAYTGLAGGANAIVNGSAAGDFLARTEGGAVLVSTDGGTTASLKLAAAAGPMTATVPFRGADGSSDGTSAGVGFAAAADAGMTYDAGADGLLIGNNSGSAILFAVGTGQDVTVQADDDVSLTPGDDAFVSAGGDVSLSSGSGEISFTGNLRGVVGTGAGASRVVRFNGVRNAAPARPACSTSTNAGDVFYIDDTDDGVAGQLCGCFADSAGNYAWRTVADPATTCAGTGTLVEEGAEAVTFHTSSLLSTMRLDGLEAFVVLALVLGILLAGLATTVVVCLTILATRRGEL